MLSVRSHGLPVALTALAIAAIAVVIILSMKSLRAVNGAPVPPEPPAQNSVPHDTVAAVPQRAPVALRSDRSFSSPSSNPVELALDTSILALPPNRLNCTTPSDCGECLTFADCPPGHTCFIDPATRRYACLASNCLSSEDCPSSWECRRFNLPQEDDVILRCIEPGSAQEGEPCSPVFFGFAHIVCAANLTCVSSTCVPVCDDDTDCRDGWRCANTATGRACWPVSPCKDSNCPPGHVCEPRLTGGRCIPFTGTNCYEEDVCAEGEVCFGSYSARHNRVLFKCWLRCSPLAEFLGQSPCPDGYICGGGGRPGHCFRECQRDDFNSCGPEEVCATIDEARVRYGCQTL